MSKREWVVTAGLVLYAGAVVWLVFALIAPDEPFYIQLLVGVGLGSLTKDAEKLTRWLWQETHKRRSQ